MINTMSCNCIVCAQEFQPDELQSLSISKINNTKFKICLACLDKCDPADDYKQAHNIINSYLNCSYAKDMYNEVLSILDSRKL